MAALIVTVRPQRAPGVFIGSSTLVVWPGTDPGTCPGMSEPPQATDEPGAGEPGAGGSSAGEPAVGPPGQNPLRGPRTSGVWWAVTTLAVILVLLIIFIAQNTDRVAVHFLSWSWHAPVAVTILTGVVAGMVLAVVAGTLRIWQLHRRVRRSS